MLRASAATISVFKKHFYCIEIVRQKVEQFNNKIKNEKFLK
jgi:hypothetical protein